jgi:uncharacterized paraquat-inducible protein A
MGSQCDFVASTKNQIRVHCKGAYDKIKDRKCPHCHHATSRQGRTSYSTHQGQAQQSDTLSVLAVTMQHVEISQFCTSSNILLTVIVWHPHSKHALLSG